MSAAHRLRLLDSFPSDQYPKMLENQQKALKAIEESDGSLTLELPTGSGKTAIGYTFLKALARSGKGPLFYVTPNKVLVEQVKSLHPEVAIALGRNAHPCLYDRYPAGKFNADEIPCSLLADCSHRVDQETGAVKVPGAVPCPYLLQKFQAKQAGIVVCTSAFYLFAQLLARDWPTPAGLVIDEAHKIASVVRNCLSFELSDYHLRRAIELLKAIGARREARQLAMFLRRMVKVIRAKPRKRSTLLEEAEIQDLLDVLSEIDVKSLKVTLHEAVISGRIDTVEKREVLKRLEVLVRDLHRYVSAFEYALPTDKRHPLNFTYAFYRRELKGNEKAQYWLVVRAYHVAPLVKRILGERTVAYSATIGDPGIFGFESGIKFPFTSFISEFPVEHTRVFMPTDTPDLAARVRGRQDLARVLRRIAKACKSFADKGQRSLVIVVSNDERERFLALAAEEGVRAVSYGNGVAPKDAAHAFKGGVGDVLVGTVANYGEGVDLPRSLAPVIFFLRPSYPPPDDPMAVFENRRFGKSVWRLWNWRVMIEALQVRGRNVRSADDLGVTFFISQQFRRFVFASLPKWLQPAYKGTATLEECVKEAKGLLKS